MPFSVKSQCTAFNVSRSLASTSYSEPAYQKQRRIKLSAFDFISHKDFRGSLEADYKEMQHCLSGEAWKSVQVLAGSIVETLLIDYLVSTPVPGRPSKNPLQMDLSEAIDICRSEKIPSDRAANLCAVVRSYRNLIHPGRMVRLNEVPPDKDSATVASTLVHMIASELGAARIKNVGMTADQIVSKIISDQNSLSILKHLLKETREDERASMLLELIPSAHKELLDDDDPFDMKADRLAAAFGQTFEIAAADTKTTVATYFVRMLKEADSRHVEWYTDTFLTPAVFSHISEHDQPFVKDYLFGRVGRIHTAESLKVLICLGANLDPDDAMRWVDPFVRLVVSGGNTELKERALIVFSKIISGTSSSFDEAIKKRLKTWLNATGIATDAEKKKAVETLLDYVEIPF